MSKVVLYDLPSKGRCHCWSPNTWKPRLAFNYKGIPYETEWVEYPDLAPKFKAMGIPPNDPDDPGYFKDYTSPVVRFEDGSYVMDSWKIAQELEKRHPSPPLYLDSPLVKEVREGGGKIFRPIIPCAIPNVHHNLLTENSTEYFRRTREESAGMTLEEWEKSATEEDWQKSLQAAKEFAEVLKREEGPFFMGQTVSYADLTFVSFLQFIKRIDQKLFDRVVAVDEAYTKLYDASKQWLEKDD